VYLATVAFLGPGVGPSAVAALTDFYFANDAMVGRSISVVVSAAAVVSVALLVSSIGAYVRKTEAPQPWSGGSLPPKAAREDELARRAW